MIPFQCFVIIQCMTLLQSHSFVSPVSPNTSEEHSLAFKVKISIQYDLTQIKTFDVFKTWYVSL